MKKYWLAAVLIGLIIGCILIMPVYRKHGPVDLWLSEKYRLGTIGSLFREYEITHPSEVRPTFPDLLKFATEDRKKWLGTFRDPSTGGRVPWIDLTDLHPVDRGKKIIMAAPISTETKLTSGSKLLRLILWSDLTTEFISEDEFASQVGK